MPFATAIPLGQGGTGEVLKAWDEERGCHVALKLLHRGDPDSLARLQREARAQARLDHPNICDVYEVAETPDGRPYIAMRFVDGLPLDEALENEPLERRLEVLAEVAETVQAAHAQSLIHRDLKPGNILVERRDDDRLHPFVLDFGIVRLEGVPGATATGEVLGTPGYLSPEQASGSREIDRRSDVFVLGILLYELIAGHNPFVGDSKVDSLMRVLRCAAPRLRTLVPQVPASLEAIAEKALEREPRRRYESAQALAGDLRAFLAGRATQARPASWVTRSHRRLRQHPLIMVAAAMSLLALVAVFTVWAVGERRAEKRAAFAERLAQRAGEIEAKARYEQLLPTHDVTSAMDRLTEETESLRALVASGGILAEGSGDYALGRALFALGRHEEAADHLRRALDSGYASDGLVAATARALALAYGDRQTETVGTPGAREKLRVELSADVERYLVPADSGAAGAEATEDPWVLALIAFHSGDAETALEHTRRAARAEPWRFEADLLESSIQRDRALDLLKVHETEAAQSALAALREASLRAADKAPSAAEAYYKLCDAAPLAARFVRTDDPQEKVARLGELEAQARVDCARVLEVDPLRYKAPLRLGMMVNFLAYEALRLGEDPSPRMAEVERLAAQSLAIEERNAQGYALRAAVRLTRASDALNRGLPIEEARFEGAVADMERAIELRPGRPFEWEWLGASYAFWAFARGDAGLPSSQHLYTESTAAYAKAIALGAGSQADAYVAICEVEARGGEEAFELGLDPAPALARARAACGKVLEIASDYTAAHTQLGAAALTEARVALAAGADPRDAIDAALEALVLRHEAAADDPEVATHRARAHLMRAAFMLHQGESAAADLDAAQHALAPAEKALPRDYRLLETRRALLESVARFHGGGSWRPAFDQAERQFQMLVDEFSAPQPSPSIERLGVEIYCRGAEMAKQDAPSRVGRLADRGRQVLAAALSRRPAQPELLAEQARLDALLR